MSHAALGIASSEIIIVFVLLGYALLAARIAEKAGYSRWWSLAMLVPIANLLVVWLFAFSDWPVRRSDRAADHSDRYSPLRT